MLFLIDRTMNRVISRTWASALNRHALSDPA